MAAPAPILGKILSWNIQILGKAKAGKLLGLSVIAGVIKSSGADVVAIQEIVYVEANWIAYLLIQALLESGDKDAAGEPLWDSVMLQALPQGADRDGYLFLWRKDKYKQLVADGKGVAGNFTGDFPNNLSAKNGRRPGYVGLTRADGSSPFLVTAYHAPTYASLSLGSAPATGLKAIAAESAQLLNYTEGGASKAYSASFLCADFNLDINDKDAAGDNFTRWYNPVLVKTGMKAATTANTFLAPTDPPLNPRPSVAAGYATKNFDNILACPCAKLGATEVLSTIDVLADKTMLQIGDAFLVANGLTGWLTSDLHTRYLFARTYISDHLPVVATFQLS